jgi:redox-sensitive bicupin YhaK (pirin superfamily)
MITVRRAGDRGRTKLSWLDSRHTFSFGDYHDPDHMGFGALRVINDDRVAPGGGFATHGHRDMDIVTYVLSGALQHRDSLGNGSVIRPGDVQRMSAGTGIQHSEFNASRTEPVHFLQIWIVPRSRGAAPSYEQRALEPANLAGRWTLIAAEGGRAGAVHLDQTVDLYATVLEHGQEAIRTVRPGRRAWLQVARGAVRVDGLDLAAGDGAALGGEPQVRVGAAEASEVLLFELE